MNLCLRCWTYTPAGSPLLPQILCLLASLVSSCLALGASMEEVEITVTQLAGAGNWELPYSVNTLDQSDLQQQFARNLPEALVEQPGVLVQKTANGHGSPFIRGFTGYRTLVLIDGVRYNNSVYRDGPNEYFSLIDLGSIEKLELLNGPASALYGSDAIGGSLYLQTQSSPYNNIEQGKGFINAAQQYRYESAENSHQSHSEFQFGYGEQWGVYIGLGTKHFGNVDAAKQGELENTGYDEWAGHIRSDIALTDDWLFTAVHQQLQQDDVWRTHSTIYAKSFAGTEIGSDLRRLKDQQRQLSYIKFSNNQMKSIADTFELTVSRQHWDEDADRIRNDNRRTLQGFESTMWGASIKLSDTLFSAGKLVYGGEFYRDTVDSERRDFNADGSLNSIRIQGPVGDNSTFEQLGIYAQYSTELSERIQLIAGSRWSQVNAEVGRYEDPFTSLPASFKGQWNSLDSSLRGLVNVNDRNLLWLGISQAFRAPNIADLSRFGRSRSSEFEVAATGLSPENFLTYELGWRLQTSRAEWQASYYYTDIDDFIASTPTGNIAGGLIEVSKRNSASGFIQGVEIKLDIQLSDTVTLFAHSTWLEGELDTFDSTLSNSARREPASRIMPVTTVLGTKWQPTEQFWLRGIATYADKADKLSPGDKNDLQRIPPGGTPSYTLVNLHAGYTPGKNISAIFGISNVLDEAYRSHGSGSNEPGRSVDFSLKVRL